MTAAEYQKAYVAARAKGATLTRAMMAELKKVYIQAGEDVAAEIAVIKARELSALTLQEKENIAFNLEQGANNIRSKMESLFPGYIGKEASSVTSIDAQYLIDIMPSNDKITKAGVKALATAINERVVMSVVNRMFSDGYTISDRIWKVGTSYSTQINRVISAGFAQGRDPIKIAKDLQVYIKDGKVALATRFGKLESGTASWMNRISGQVDYRALRLVRSELYMSLQQAGAEAGRANPGALDSYDWILNGGRQHWDCQCEPLANASPYTYNTIPGYPHPNCACRVQARLRDHDEFLSDLTSWADGGSVGYLDDWYSNLYLPVA